MPGEQQLTVLVVGATGSVGRYVVAEGLRLVGSLTSSEADHKTLELVAVRGAAPGELDSLFAGLRSDHPGAADGVLDRDNLPLADEPARVLADLEAVKRHAR
jgi:hypothetical protein